MSAKKSLAALKGAFAQEEKKEGGGNFGNYYNFWDMPVGTRAVVRFLPDLNENNARGFLVEKVTHNLTVNGQKRTVPCLSMYDEECPVCKVSQDYYKAKDEVNGKKYWKKRQYIAQALIVEDPLPKNDDTGENAEGKVKAISLGFQIYNIIKEAFGSDELEAVPYDFSEGYDFIIKKTEQGQYASYAVGTKFANKQRALTDIELEAVEAGMVDLSTLLPANPGEEFIRTRLNADLNGEELEEGSGRPAGKGKGRGEENEEFESKPAPKKAAKPAPVDEDDAPAPAPAKKAAKPAEDEGDSSVDDMLAAIRARRAGK
jgi:hypothetical protein